MMYRFSSFSSIPTYRPPCKIKAFKNWLRIDSRWHPQGYRIHWQRCNTPGKILGWLEQLSGKIWIDKFTLIEIAKIMYSKIGIEINRNL